MITIYHNNRCSKSRQCLTILQNENTTYRVRNYLQEPLNISEIKSLQKKLGVPVSAMIRAQESIYQALFKDRQPSEDELIEAIAEHPILLQRPIVELEDSAVIARPPEKVFDYIS